MSENKKTGIGAWSVGIFSFLTGLFIGLVILGWWLWPVQWTNATYEILIPEQQEDFLRSAIDSYALEPDAALANQRYQGLGVYGPSTLGAIVADPGAQSAAEIEGFATAVGATDVIQNPPARPTDATTAELAVGRAIASPATAGLCVLVVLLLVGLLLLFLLRRGRKRPGTTETPELAPDSTSAISPDEAPLALEPVEAVAEPSEMLPVEQEEALPDWLQETPSTEGEPEEPADISLETAQEEFAEESTPPEAGEEKDLSDEEIAEITSSQFGADQEEQDMPDFMKAISPGKAAGVVLAAGAGVAAAAAVAGDDEDAAEPIAAASVEEPPLYEGVLAAAAGLAGGDEPAAPEIIEELPISPDELAGEPGLAVPETDQYDDVRGEAAPISDLLEFEAKETQAEAHAKFGQDIQSVTGIGPTYGEKLRQAGITSPLLLLRNGATAKGRKKIAEDSGVSEKLILKWVNFVDLYRIKGVSEAYAELLEAAGVDTVPELANRNPSNLHAKILEVIEEKRTYRTPPELLEVESWVAQAKKLPRAIHY